MKIAAAVSLASVALAACEVTINGQGFTGFELKFSNQAVRPITQQVPAGSDIDRFRFAATKECGKCSIYAPGANLGRFRIEGGRSDTYLMNFNRELPDTIPTRFTVTCA
jgi:hypothetical protein